MSRYNNNRCRCRCRCCCPCPEPLPPKPVNSSIVVKAILKGKNEVPANDSNGTGKLVGLLSEVKLRYDFVLHTENLGSTIVAAHFHDGEKGVNGPIVKTINIDPLNGVAVGSWTAADLEPLTLPLIEKLKTGKLYVNVHTLNYPGGEIRGQTHVTACL